MFKITPDSPETERLALKILTAHKVRWTLNDGTYTVDKAFKPNELQRLEELFMLGFKHYGQLTCTICPDRMSNDCWTCTGVKDVRTFYALY